MLCCNVFLFPTQLKNFLISTKGKPLFRGDLQNYNVLQNVWTLERFHITFSHIWYLSPPPPPGTMLDWIQTQHCIGGGEGGVFKLLLKNVVVLRVLEKKGFVWTITDEIFSTLRAYEPVAAGQTWRSKRRFTLGGDRFFFKGVDVQHSLGTCLVETLNKDRWARVRLWSNKIR